MLNEDLVSLVDSLDFLVFFKRELVVLLVKSFLEAECEIKTCSFEVGGMRSELVFLVFENHLSFVDIVVFLLHYDLVIKSILLDL